MLTSLFWMGHQHRPAHDVDLLEEIEVSTVPLLACTSRRQICNERKTEGFMIA